MRLVSIYAAIGVLITELWLPRAALAMTCNPRLSEDYQRYADWVFVATLVEARQSELSPHTVHIVVANPDPLRGSPPDRIELTANLGTYEPEIIIGARYLIFVDPSDRHVGTCRGFQRYSAEAMFLALLLRRKGDCGAAVDRDEVVKFLRGEFFQYDEPLSRDRVEGLVRSFRELNSELSVLQSSDRINVKGIEFLFIDKALVGVEIGKCTG